MSGNIKFNIDLASRVVTQNQYQWSWYCISILIQYQKSSKWHVKSQYQNQEMDFVFSRSKQYQDWIWSANINIKTNILDNILEFFKILDIFQPLWRHCYLKGTHYLMGIWTPYLNVCLFNINIQYQDLAIVIAISNSSSISQKMFDNFKLQDSTLKLDQSRLEVNIKS